MMPEERERTISISGDARPNLERLLQIAMRDTGQSRRVANFLLAWHNAQENGGWDPTDLWAVDPAIAADMVTVLMMIMAHRGKHLNDLGYGAEIGRIWDRWRNTKEPTQ